ncbi:protein phosphatase 2C domain-containing protein [Gammaproteobacteria bacterium]|nr:protein phosphatase 2C domain-containing protein [Gammaproteobacteria bacterium]
MARQKQEKPFYAFQILGSRDEQEDSYGICYGLQTLDSSGPSCFILADGMGGHLGGSIASQTAVDAVKLVVESGGIKQNRLLRDALSSANENIAECLRVNEDLEGMGTTLVVLMLKDNKAFWVSVGDSPLLSFDLNSQISHLNEDHSMRPVLERLVESGLIQRDDAEYSQKINQLRSALTGSSIELYDINEQGVSLASTRYLILASDGLETLTRDEISAIVMEQEGGGAEMIAVKLIDAVDQKANLNQDNTTLIVIDTQAMQ